MIKTMRMPRLYNLGMNWVGFKVLSKPDLSMMHPAMDSALGEVNLKIFHSFVQVFHSFPGSE